MLLSFSVNSRHSSKKNSNAIYVTGFSVFLEWNSSTLMLQVKWHYCWWTTRRIMSHAVEKVRWKRSSQGDQLFEEHARNVIWTFQDGDNESDCLMGLHPEFADWHTKVNLYEVRAAVTYLWHSFNIFWNNHFVLLLVYMIESSVIIHIAT